MKCGIRRAGVGMACAVLLSAAAARAEMSYDGPAVTLTYSNYYPESNKIAQECWKPFLTHVTEGTKGKIQFTEHWAGALHSLNDGFKACKAGITDITQAYCHNHGGMFRLMHVGGLPLAFRDPAVASRVMEELYPRYFKQEYEKHGVYLSTMTMLNMGGIISIKPVRSLEDMKGLRLFTGGGLVTDSYTALGAVSVAVSGGDLFSALQRGIIDGVCFSKGMVIPRRFHEIAKYYTDTGLVIADLATCVNRKKFDKLPPALQKDMYRLSRESSYLQTVGYMNMDRLAEDELRANGVEIITLSAEELERWRLACQPVWDRFVEENEKRGLPARRLVEDMRTLSARYGAMSLEELKTLAFTDPVPGIIDGQ